MEKHSYTFQFEPRNKAYTNLIHCSQSTCKYAMLVINPRNKLDQYGNNALKALEKFFIKEEETNEWPGTKLLKGMANLYKYNYTKECADEIAKLARGLYDWIQPRLPEDLCLLRDLETPWLVSISHERDAYLLLSEFEYNSIIAQIPELKFGLMQDT